MPAWKLERAKAMRQQPTLGESALWQALRGRRLDNTRFRRQEPLFGWIADFYCARTLLVVEVDGRSHRARSAEDGLRDAVLLQHGFRTLRFTNAAVLHHLPTVLAAIRLALSAPR
jgi:very-short-patch-repair endonuclease